MINKERALKGHHKLYVVPYLNECAKIRAKEQVELAGHTRPNGEWYSTIIDQDKLQWGSVWENIALGSKTAEETVNDWKNSSKNGSAAMNENYIHTGVDVYYDGNSKKWHWVQIYTNDAESDIVHEGQYLPTNQES